MSLYHQHRAKLNSGDLLICEDKSLFWRYIGHTAGVYQNGAGQLMVAESTSRGMTGLSGVQLHPLGDWLRFHNGQVYVRHLMFGGKHLTQKPPIAGFVTEQLERFIQKYRGSSYPNLKTRTGRFKLYLARLDFGLFGDWLKYDGPDQGIFCTMLWIMFYLFLGAVKTKIPAEEFEPRDTYQGRKMDKAFKSPWSLGPPVRIQ